MVIFGVLLLLRISCCRSSLLLLLFLAYFFEKLLIYTDLFKVHSLSTLLLTLRKIYKSGVISIRYLCCLTHLH